MKMVNKKRGLKKFNISNRLAYILIIILSIALFGIGVYAYGGTAPSTVGHTMGELMPSCTGWLRGTSGSANSWSCTAVPPTCSGTNQVLHWDGSAWSCYTVSAGSESCSWATWNPPCKCIGHVGLECASNIYPVLVHQEYCSGGVITQERDIYCCPTDGDGLCIQT